MNQLEGLLKKKTPAFSFIVNKTPAFLDKKHIGFKPSNY